MRRTAVLLCLGLLLFAALLPGAAVDTPLQLHDDAAVVGTSRPCCRAASDPVPPLLLDVLTATHLARASLPSAAV